LLLLCYSRENSISNETTKEITKLQQPQRYPEFRVGQQPRCPSSCGFGSAVLLVEAHVCLAPILPALQPYAQTSTTN
jgi:hypothetical protein